jgi:hypothetical protein
MRSSSSKVPTSIRFSTDTEDRLARISESTRIPTNKLIEVFVVLGLTRVEAAGALTIPLGGPLKADTEQAAQQETVSAILAAAAEQASGLSQSRKRKGK